MKFTSLLISLALYSTVGFAGVEYVQTKNIKEVEGITKPIFKELGIYEVKTNKKTNFRLTKEQNKLEKFLKTPLTLREGGNMSVPDDIDFNDQWSLQTADAFGVNAADAWGITVGGFNPGGEEVVIAIVDGGFDTDHIDLIENAWVNKGEIAGNDIDDDGNGYVDDIMGWNARDENGTLTEERHGTHVTGIAGASGNNGNQVVGINWNVKIMYVSLGRSLAQTEETLRGYNYILEQKKLWLETNGEKGANVVAINSSFGIDRQKCDSDEYTLWNDVYDALGEYGILSIAATTNSSTDVDLYGDVPTSCSSPYIVSVTNSNDRGERYSAGYGLESIDLAAPGTGILSTIPNDRTGNLTGTSMSTPHVTGTVALLHSAASDEFYMLNKANPAEAALALKEVILKTVTPIAEFEGAMVAPGILNLGAAALEMSRFTSIPDSGSDEDGDSDAGDDNNVGEGDDGGYDIDDPFDPWDPWWWLA